MFRRAYRVLFALGVVSLVLGGFVTTASATPDGPSENSKLARLTGGGWQGSGAIRAAAHPFADPPGNDHDCTYNQEPNGKTWFLGAVFNMSGNATRDCTVPKGTALLVPALNADCSSLEVGTPFFGTTAAEQAACVRAINMEDWHVELDGRAVPLTYVVSPQVRVHVPDGNVLVGTGPSDGTLVSAGYWALVHPSKGDHVLTFGGTFPDFDYTISIIYNLHVV